MKDHLQPEAQSETSLQFLSFRVGKTEYGIDIMSVKEIKGYTETTRLPNMPEFMLGVINLRGSVIPIFDLHSRFGMERPVLTPKHAVIILGIEGRTVGLLVDAVSDILTVHAEDIKPAPDNDLQGDHSFIAGLLSINDRMVILLSVKGLFEQRAEQLAMKH